MKAIGAGAVGVALFVWTLARVGPATLAAQVSQLGVMVPLVLALAGVRFVMQAAGWRLAIKPSVRPTLVHALRAVIAGEAAGYLTLGPISREPVKALMLRDQTPQKVSLSAAIVERAAYLGAATLLVVFSLVLLAVRLNRASWIVPAFVSVILAAGLWTWLRKRVSRVPSEQGWRSHFSRHSGRYGPMSRRALAGLTALAILQEVVNVFETYAVLAWLGAGPTLEAAIALEGLSRLANAPAQLIPGKLGVLEVAGSTFAGILHLGNANGLTLVLARRLRSLAWTGVGVLLLTTSASRHGATRADPALV
jgi:hypothetical protein